MGRIFLAHCLRGRRDAGAVDEDAGDAMRCFGPVESSGDAYIVGDVGGDVDTTQCRSGL